MPLCCGWALRGGGCDSVGEEAGRGRGRRAEAVVVVIAPLAELGGELAPRQHGSQYFIEVCDHLGALLSGDDVRGAALGELIRLSGNLPDPREVLVLGLDADGVESVREIALFFDPLWQTVDLFASPVHASIVGAVSICMRACVAHESFDAGERLLSEAHGLVVGPHVGVVHMLQLARNEHASLLFDDGMAERGE